ncbi:xylanase A [Coprinopsis cinerea okayama7|uniref:Endo-1,4-beta-xylanase n=1 Tax=Coprinopsis cinerea (strain Okayama-7 / 130 / ATCC MYA-4618 / FGSC 9003) TaxID=240176 RepID=A8P8F0_COPC7|nr:xylanase A [Coprinopsis cinerea okayama7\|eukprot:XP_001839556.1 xylanase A [Coprinopsis cinerea okayama7\
MKFLSLVFAVSSAVVGALAVPTDASNSTSLLQARAGTPSSEGWHDNYFYSWWTDNQGTAYYTNQAGGQYSLQWSGNGNLVGGKGWNPGTNNRMINYSGTYQPNGNSYLAVYGWTRNALIEYYVVESYGTYDPSSAAELKGQAHCNGATYNILTTWRHQQPSIDGTQTFQQFWSVRTPKKNPGGQISGTVDFGCHAQAWRNHGMNLGSNHYYQIVATEGYFSSGQATITVW